MHHTLAVSQVHILSIPGLLLQPQPQRPPVLGYPIHRHRRIASISGIRV
jgi:hypothetical protein